MDGKTQHRFSDDYDVIKKIGRGGTADIYLARRRGSAHPIVLKRFFDQSAGALAKREIEIADRVRFPGIVRVYRSEIGADNTPFLSMEYCPGPTLEIFPGRVCEKKLLAILSSTAASLHLLHLAGFVYNDLKPSNIFCPVDFEKDDFPLDLLFHLKLADFSLAANYSGEKGDTVTGTVGYMSPEMVLKKKISPVSDLFSLGVMAYELACGQLPFRSSTNDPLEINAQVTEGERPKLCGPGKSFSKETADLIISLLAIDPAKRPPSAFALLEMLSQIGSSYRYRIAIRPRHLLYGLKKIDDAVLERLFGKDSFSPEQIKLIRQATGLDPAHLRILLEENFDRGNFARVNGRWGWKNETDEIIEWTLRQNRFALRSLCGSSPAVKKLALALAVLDDSSYAEKIAGLFESDAANLLEEWGQIPRQCHPALLYSLNRVMRSSSRKAISSQLIRYLNKSEIPATLMGRLLLYAGQDREAVKYLDQGIDESIRKSDNDLTFQLLELAAEAARKLDDRALQAGKLLTRARLEKDLGRLAEAEISYNRLIEMLSGDEDAVLLAQTYKEMGDYYKVKNDYQSGIKVLEKALAIYTTMDDSLALSHTLNNLGNMYWIAGDLDRALENYKKALAIQEKHQSQKEIATSLNNIGSIYLMKGDYSQCISYYSKSLDLRESLGEKASIAQSWNNLGAAHFLMGDAVKAADSFAHSLQLNREVGARAEELLNIENLAEAKILAGQLQDALKYLKEGTTLADKIGETSHKCTVNRLTGQLLRRMGYYDDAEVKLKTALDLATRIDNKALILLCHLGLARLYRQLRENEAMAHSVSEGTRIAGEMGDKNAQFHLALTQLSHTGDESYRKTAEGLVDNLDTDRDKALLYLELLELQNDLGMTDKSRKYIEQANLFFSEQPEDIDQARYNLALARYHNLIDDHGEARTCAKDAATLAGKSNLLPEQWQAQAFLSELEFNAKDFEAAFKSARNATDCLKKIAGHIKDRDRLNRFYNNRRIVDLLGRIKSLQTILSKMKGAALVGSP